MDEPRYPSLYQIHTRVWLYELSQRLGRSATLDDIDSAELEQIAERGFDWVWLLGVWQTGPAGRRVSLTRPEWRREYRECLADFTDDDVCGSPFAIQSYALHRDFGDGQSLARLRDRLHERGLRLLLDFVPNHTALDHAWVQEHPEFYVCGTEEDLTRAPQNYCRLAVGQGTRVFAHGRDPYFDGWPDTAQLNYRHAGLRSMMAQELQNVADQCDGIRCDMAMLVLPDVFLRTWGDAALPNDGREPVDEPFWPAAIDTVRRRHPEFRFMAEVYWDLEWALQQQGFDDTYDKRMYDRQRSGNAEQVRQHLLADAEFQRKSVRFLENHDEPPAAAVFPADVHRATAVAAFFVPGLRFFHQGQLEGRRTRPCLHLRRRPDDPGDPALREFYHRLLECLKRSEVRDGRWQLLDCRAAWDGNSTSRRFLAFAWEGAAGQRLVVAVNFGPTQGQCYVRLPMPDLRGRQFLLQDLLSPAAYQRAGGELAASGLYLDMPAWGYHVLDVLPD